MRDLVRGWWPAVALAASCCAMPAQSAEDVASQLKKTFQERFPSIKIDSIEPAPMPGIYEVIAGDDTRLVRVHHAVGREQIDVARIDTLRCREGLNAATRERG